jgi:hypothetical protein
MTMMGQYRIMSLRTEGWSQSYLGQGLLIPLGGKRWWGKGVEGEYGTKNVYTCI